MSDPALAAVQTVAEAILIERHQEVRQHHLPSSQLANPSPLSALERCGRKAAGRTRSLAAGFPYNLHNHSASPLRIRPRPADSHLGFQERGAATGR